MQHMKRFDLTQPARTALPIGAATETADHPEMKNPEERVRSTTTRPEEHGYIRWPVPGDTFMDTGEGGLSVYAVWLSAETEVCLPGAVAWITGDVVFWHEEDRLMTPVEGLPKDLWPTRSNTRIAFSETPDIYEDTAGCQGFLYLGSTRLALAHRDSDGEYGGVYFQATMDDLTDEGRRLLSQLSKHYGAEPELLTFLDT